MPILVTGATGSVGRHLLAELLAAGADVRAVTRDLDRANLPAGIEVVAGNYATGDLPAGIFDGVERAFVFPADEGICAFAAAAGSAGLERLVAMSSAAASLRYPRDQRSVSARHHLAFETDLHATGIPLTILRPGPFANNLLGWAHTIRAAGFAAGPYPESRQAPLHEADVAAVAAVALLEDGNALDGQILELSGPQALTRREQLAAIGAALGRDLIFREQAPGEFAAAMAPYMPSEIIEMVLDHWRDTQFDPDLVFPTTEAVTGRPARTLSEWARDHVADFS